MWPYWLMFFYAAIPSLFVPPRRKLRVDGSRSISPDTIWLMTLFFLTLLVGFRYQVGGDWGGYERYYLRATYSSFWDALSSPDPGYELINLLSANLGFGIAGVNLISGAIFSAGVLFFCRSLPRPWLALAVAVPYLIIVVGMGYTRQAVALGLIMFGFLAISRKRYVAFVLWVCVAATFHKTAVLLIPIAALTTTTNRYLIGLFVLVIAGLAYKVLLEDAVDHLIVNYVDSEYQSSGAFIRLAMNIVPAGIFLVFRKRFLMPLSEMKLWKLMSWIAVGTFLAFFVTSASTALDRIALYVIPLQLVVFAHLPDVLGRRVGLNREIVVSIVAYYTVVLFVWLNYAAHSRYWIPYSINF